MKRRGPPLEPGIDGVRRVTTTLDELTLRMLEGLGRGNVSAGIRRAARIAYAVDQATPEPINPGRTTPASA